MVPEPLSIHPLAQDAGREWLALMNRSLDDCPGFEPLLLHDYQRLIGQRPSASGVILAAERGGELVGAVTLLFGRYQAYLRQLAVRPDARRRGIGRALVSAALDRFRQRGLEIACAQDWDASPYRSLYQELGFRLARRHPLLSFDLTRPLPDLPTNRRAIVRRPDPADAEAMAYVYARMYRPDWDWSREGTVEEKQQAYSDRFSRQLIETDDALVYLIALMDGRIVGGVTVRQDRDENRAGWAAAGSLNPGGVGVLPPFRRQGIGGRLLSEALALFRARWTRQVTVWTFSHLDSDSPAFAFYCRAGAAVLRQSLTWEMVL